jgi:hypothetical protein
MDPPVKEVVLPFEFSVNTARSYRKEWKDTQKKLPLNLDEKAVENILRSAG